MPERYYVKDIFIQRSNELLQEFHFAHSDTKVKLNTVYNSHFSGSNCWDLTGRACEMFEATFNRNIKLTYNLPYPTHRNLLQPISNLKPLRVTLAKRFLTFTEKLRQSEKPVLRSMIGLVEHDVQTVEIWEEFSNWLKSQTSRTSSPVTWTTWTSTGTPSSGGCSPSRKSSRSGPGNSSFLTAGLREKWRPSYRPLAVTSICSKIQVLNCRSPTKDQQEVTNSA